MDHPCPGSDGLPALIGVSLSPEEACGFSSRKYHAVGRRTLSVWGKRLSAGLAGLFHRMSPRGPRSARKYHVLGRGTLCRYGRKRRLAGDLPSHTAARGPALARASMAASPARIRPNSDELCRYGLERRLAGVSRAPPPRPALALCVEVFWRRGWLNAAWRWRLPEVKCECKLDRPCLPGPPSTGYGRNAPLTDARKRWWARPIMKSGCPSPGRFSACAELVRVER